MWIMSVSLCLYSLSVHINLSVSMYQYNTVNTVNVSQYNVTFMSVYVNLSSSASFCISVCIRLSVSGSILSACCALKALAYYIILIIRPFHQWSSQSWLLGGQHFADGLRTICRSYVNHSALNPRHGDEKKPHLQSATRQYMKQVYIRLCLVFCVLGFGWWPWSTRSSRSSGKQHVQCNIRD